MTILLTKAWYEIEKGKPVVVLRGRDEKGRRRLVKVRGFEPYFYSVNPIKHPKVKKCIKVDLKSIDGNELYKVVTYLPKDVPVVRVHSEKHYEADIPFSDRFLIDNGIKAYFEVKDGKIVNTKPKNIKPRVAIIDIEVRDDRGFPRPDVANEEVIAITVYDSYLDKYVSFVKGHIDREKVIEYVKKNGMDIDVEVRSFKNESDMLSAFDKFVEALKPDIITGWNVEAFDLTYLKNRMKSVGEWFYEAVIMDMEELWMELHENKPRWYNLEYASQEVLGVGKVTKPYSSVYIWYMKNREEMLSYNIKDVWLVKMIDEKLRAIEFFLLLHSLTGVQLDSVTMHSRIADSLILRSVHGKLALPSKPYADVNDESVEGATVFDPQVGVYENVAVLDFKSMYPSIYISLNISPETRARCSDDTIRTPQPGVCFTKRKKGVIPSIVEDLIRLRDGLKQRMKEAKDEMERKAWDDKQRVVKFVTNAFYGVMRFPNFRLYNPDIAAAITATGRECLRWIKGYVEKEFGYRVLYGDTDSVFVWIQDDNPIEKGRELEKALNESFDEMAKELFDVDRHRFKIKFEKLYGKWFQSGKKKRYAGYVVWKDGEWLKEPIFDIKGYESRRSDRALLTSKVISDLLKSYLSEGKEGALRYLRDVYCRLKEGDVSLSEVGIPISWNREHYRGNPQHIRAFKNANKYMGKSYGYGSKALKVFVLGPVDVIAVDPDDSADDIPFQIDWYRQIEKVFWQPLEGILESMSITKDDVLGRKSLFAF